MSKISPTPIGTPLFVNRTMKLYAVAASIAIWTLLTTSLTVLAINSKYFHNTYQCQSTTIQPIKTLNQPIDQKQSKLISRISTLYSVPKNRAYEIVGIINSYTKPKTFPTTEMVLAVIAVESRFQQHATSSAGAKGYMQILHTSGKIVTSEPWQNIRGGIELLKEYRQQLNSDKQALAAYNVGIGSVQRGGGNPKYAEKVLTELSKIKGV